MEKFKGNEATNCIQKKRGFTIRQIKEILKNKNYKLVHRCWYFDSNNRYHKEYTFYFNGIYLTFMSNYDSDNFDMIKISNENRNVIRYIYCFYNYSNWTKLGLLAYDKKYSKIPRSYYKCKFKDC